MTKCNQLLPIMKDPIGDSARQSNSQAEGERQLSPQRAFEKSQTSQAIGVSGNELKVQARRRPQESQPEHLPPQPEKAQVKDDGIADKRCPRTGRRHKPQAAASFPPSREFNALGTQVTVQPYHRCVNQRQLSICGASQESRSLSVEVQSVMKRWVLVTRDEKGFDMFCNLTAPLVQSWRGQNQHGNDDEEARLRGIVRQERSECSRLP